jgi:DNA-binding SARP family transcriptional activator
MGSVKFHEIWMEQCDAARDIKIRFGLKAAFDYLVAEKLPDFAGAAADHPEFARELPRFVSEVRGMFTTEEIRTHIARVEREQRERDANAAEDDDDELIRESPAIVAKQARQFATIKELLTAPELGTS